MPDEANRLPKGPWRRLVAVDPWLQLAEVRTMLELGIGKGEVRIDEDPFHGTWVRILVGGVRFFLPNLIGTDFRHDADPLAAARQLLRVVSDDADTSPGWQNRIHERRDAATSLMLAFANGIDRPVATEFTAVDEEDGLPSLRLWNASRATWRSIRVPMDARIAAARLHGHVVHLEKRSGQWLLKPHPMERESGVGPVDPLSAMRAVEGNPR